MVVVVALFGDHYRLLRGFRRRGPIPVRIVPQDDATSLLTIHAVIDCIYLTTDTRSCFQLEGKGFVII